MTVCLEMTVGFGYLTPDGVKFTKEHPFNLVDESEVDALMATERFELADPKRARAHYRIGE